MTTMTTITTSTTITTMTIKTAIQIESDDYNFCKDYKYYRDSDLDLDLD